MAEDRDYKQLRLARRSVQFLFVYYLIIFITFLILSLFLIYRYDGQNSSQIPLYISLSMAAIGSSMFYSRKLYKACIVDSYTFTDRGERSIQAIGSFMFFLLRPIFAAALALCGFFLWKSALLASLESPSQFSETHVYISGSLGFFSGFLAGRLIERLEETGLQELETLRSGKK